MPKYKKKPIIVEAWHWTNDDNQEAMPLWLVQALKKDVIRELVCDDGPVMQIKTLEGIYQARIGDFIIQGIHGEIYPCKSDIFKISYELVKE